MAYGFKVIVEGDYAGFNRPELKTERVTYDVPTVGALEGMLKCVYWKPAFRIVIDKIVVFNPIKTVNIRRNEVKTKLPLKTVRAQMNGGGAAVIYTPDVRTQRGSVVLKDVKYGIEFHIERTFIRSDHEDECEEKHYNIMLRRLKKGQCFRQPCLGCREFSVKRLELVDDLDLSEVAEENMGRHDLGLMLYGMRFRDGGKPINGDWEHPQFSDKADAMYYHPYMIDGVIDVAEYRKELKC